MGVSSWALIRTLKHEVLGEKLDPEYEVDIRQNLPKDQAGELLSAASHKSALYRAQYDIHQSIQPLTKHINELDKLTLINKVNDVALQCVECQRLYSTPIPLLYTAHALKFLTIWMSLMPFALYDTFEGSWNHIAMLPTIAILAFLFFGIEEIAVSLEEPFSILPMEEMVDEVWVSIDEVTEWMGETTTTSAVGGDKENTLGKPPL